MPNKENYLSLGQRVARGGTILAIMTSATLAQALRNGDSSEPSISPAISGYVLPESPKSPILTVESDDPPSPDEKFRSLLESMARLDNRFISLTASGYIELISKSSEAVAVNNDFRGVSVQFVGGLSEGKSSGYVISVSIDSLGNRLSLDDATKLRRAFLIAKASNSINGNALEKAGALSRVDMGQIESQIAQEKEGVLIAQK